jgi:arylsulfatase A-like enzyme
MADRFNIVFILADQLRAASLPLHGEGQIDTPHINRLAAEGLTFSNAMATCPVCTPYRSMLLTGRHPQTTGHVINFMRTRHDEIGLGDVFSHAGYATGWIGKWHLHTGSFPQVQGADFVPEGRDRLGFEYWRGYNFHCQYFNGWVNSGDWRNERWEGYETAALNRYAFEFIESAGDRPFCLFLSPHQPHHTPMDCAPQEYYDRLPDRLELPPNVPEEVQESSKEMYRHYLAMTLAIDDMVGEMMDFLDRSGRKENTLVIFTSDHGTQVGAQGIHPWEKKMPYLESLQVPLIARLPGTFEAGGTRDALVAPVDFLPTLCGLSGLPVPRTVEGHDLSKAWVGTPGSYEQESLLTMNFTASYDYLKNGREWRGVVTKDHTYARWLDGRVELFDRNKDPLQMRNLAEESSNREMRNTLETQMRRLMERRGDRLIPCLEYASWFDSYRRVVRNGYGPLGDPEDAPDWSLLS